MLGEIIGGAMDLAGGIYSAEANKDMNSQNLAAQREAMKKAHQWEVKDLKKAGLNPILSAGGSGASGSVGSSIAVSNPASGVSSAARMAFIERKQAESQVELNKDLAKQAKATAQNQIAQAKLNATATAKQVAELPRAQTIGEIWSNAKGLPSKVKSHIKKSSWNPPSSWKEAKDNFFSHFR
jgi:hypothetical protein